MITKSAKETIELGRELAGYLKSKDVIALVGELASGKTTFTKGIARGLNVKNSDYVNSPSFTLIREHKGKINLYHFDLYRLNSLYEIEGLGLEEYFDSDGIVVVEWADKMKALLPKDYLKIEFNVLDNNRRQVIFKAFGERYKNIASKWKRKLQ